ISHANASTSAHTLSLHDALPISGYTAYLKISEGCDNSCAFCIIPTLRGKQRSRTIADIVAEATQLASQGVQEISLVAQDLTAYRSEEHTSELQSRENLVCRLLLE